MTLTFSIHEMRESVCSATPMHLYQRSPRVQAVALLDQGFTVIRRVLLEKTIIHHDVISRKRLGL